MHHLRHLRGKEPPYDPRYRHALARARTVLADYEMVQPCLDDWLARRSKFTSIVCAIRPRLRDVFPDHPVKIAVDDWKSNGLVISVMVNFDEGEVIRRMNAFDMWWTAQPHLKSILVTADYVDDDIGVIAEWSTMDEHWPKAARTVEQVGDYLARHYNAMPDKIEALRAAWAEWRKSRGK